MSARVIVVGGGISGLTAAWRLQNAGHEITVLEAEPAVGGKIRTVERDGFRVHQGALLIGGSYRATLRLVDELGLASNLVTPTANVGIVRDGAIHHLHGRGLRALFDLARAPVISPRSKLLLARLARDAWRARHRIGYDDPAGRAQLDVESVRQYCDRRLNPELRDHFVAPLVGAIWMHDGLEMSVTELFFVLGSFLAGGMRGLRGGLDVIARVLAERLDVQTSARVSLVERDADSARVVWTKDGIEHDERVDGVVLTMCAPQVPPVYPGLEPELQGILLEGIAQAHYAVLRIALETRPDIGATFICVPGGETPEFGAIGVDHEIHPDAAPPGKGLITAFLNHEWASTRMDASDDELIDAVMPGLERLIPGIAGDISFVQIRRWEPATTRSRVGAHRAVAQLHQRIDDGRRIQHAGDYLSVATVEGSVVSGEVAARRLDATLRRAA